MVDGKLIIVSAPSGAGKTTIVHYLLSEPDLGLEFSVSATSRPKRGEEVDKQDYYFLSASEFKARIQKDEFVEWEEVYPDQFYGTLKTEIERIWAKGKAVIFDVDVVGGLNLNKLFPRRGLSIFIQAPIATLEERLRFRSTETEEKIQLRLSKASKELSYAPDFDKIVVNKDLDTAKAEAFNLVKEFLAN